MVKPLGVMGIHLQLMDRTLSISEASSVPWDSDLWTMVRWVDPSGFVAYSISPDCSSLRGVEGSS